jgi:hypothetical protein
MLPKRSSNTPRATVLPLKYSSNLNSGLLFLNYSNFIDEEHCVTLKKIKNINNLLRFLFKKFVIIFINSIKNNLASW